MMQFKHDGILTGFVET